MGTKTTTKTVEKIGTYDEIKKKCGDMDPLDWAKQYAAKRTAEEKKAKNDIIVRYSSSSTIEKIHAVLVMLATYSCKTSTIARSERYL